MPTDKRQELIVCFLCVDMLECTHFAHCPTTWLNGCKHQDKSQEIIDFEAAYFGRKLLRFLNINCGGLQKQS